MRPTLYTKKRINKAEKTIQIQIKKKVRHLYILNVILILNFKVGGIFT